MSTQDRRYPIGRFEPPKSISEADREPWIETIARAPGRMREVAQRLTAHSSLTRLIGRAGGRRGR